ncbi:MAG: tetratricopeptide repeat protein [Acidobacteriaceae bacterium]|nr:tetratricopeptide repeat protein [Acidobacteriaceae bacterium]
MTGLAIAVAMLLSVGMVQAQTALQSSVELARQGRYQQAREALAGVPAPAPIAQQIAFHRLKAAIASGLKEPKSAALEMEEALALDPQNSALLIATALAELESGDLDAALEHAKKCPENATGQALSGDIFDQRGDSAAAENAYQAAIKLAPTEERYRLLLGLHLIRHQRMADAAGVLSEGARAQTRSPRILTLLGVAQFGAGYSDEAVSSLEEAIATDPRDGAAYAVLSKIVLQSSAAPDSKAADYLCRSNPIVCAAVHLRIAYAAGDNDLLRRATETLKRAPGNDPVGKCELARAYAWEGNQNAARTELETCVRLDPTPQNHYRLGLLYQKLGLPALAAKEMSRRRELLGDMSEQTALGLSALGTTGMAAH